MFKLLNNSARRSKSIAFYEIKSLTQRQFISNAPSNNVNEGISNQASANYCFNLVR